MKTIALTTAALLVAAGSAFAGSDNFQAPSETNPSTNIDSTYTSSVKSSVFVNQPVSIDTASQDHREYWGR